MPSWRLTCLLLACAAWSGGCGGAPGRPAAGEPVAAEASPSPCEQYMHAVGPFLLRFESALEGYRAARADGTATSRADSARAMADFVDGELPQLRDVRARDPRIQLAHGDLIGSLDELRSALEQLAAAYVLDDRKLRIRALGRVDDAWQRWSRAGMGIHAMCTPPAPATAQA